jgi:hypothetical protein
MFQLTDPKGYAAPTKYASSRLDGDDLLRYHS